MEDNEGLSHSPKGANRIDQPYKSGIPGPRITKKEVRPNRLEILCDYDHLRFILLDWLGWYRSAWQW